MKGNELLFHIARQDGLEFVFASGHALSDPTHTHVSVYTITVVCKGVVQLFREASMDVHPAGSVYIVAPHEPHHPVYSDDFFIVSLCVDKNHFRDTARAVLAARCLEYSGLLADKKLLPQDTLQTLLTGLDATYDGYAPAAASCSRSGLERGRILQGSSMGAECSDETKGLEEAMPQLSPFQRIRRFRRETGLTPHQYTVQCRLREAKKLLSSGSSIADAAALAGFCDQSHLNRWFNKSIGITPRSYKDSCFYLDS